MKSLITGDLHLGLMVDGFLVNGRTNSRLIEQMKIIGDMIDYMLINGVELFIVAGDIFHTNRPTSLCLSMFIDKINKIVSCGIEVIIIGGNHDFNMSGASSIEPIKEAYVNNDKVHVFSDIPHVLYGMLFVPYFSDDKRKNVTNKVDELMCKFGPKYMIGHASIGGAVVGTEDFMIANSKSSFINIPNGISRVMLGHIHKPQEFFVGKIPIDYTGSIISIDFGERDDNKSFMVFDDKNNTIERIDIDNIKYIQVEILEDDIDKYDWGSLKNKVVKVIINNYTGKCSIVDIEHRLKDIYMIRCIKFNKKDDDRDKIIDNAFNLSPIDALKLYFKDHKNKDIIIKKGIDVLQECDDER